jgi:RimJ/RimL family protein N-acetyltransferase
MRDEQDAMPAAGSAGVEIEASVPDVLSTERLHLREIEARDAALIVELLNDPSWLRFIGDKNVRTRADAERYIEEGPRAMYRRLGFGLYLVELRSTGKPTGICGLIRRAGLDDVDLGFAFLPRHCGKGYAFESSVAMLGYAREVLALPRVVAITSRDNVRSARLLARLGFRFERDIRLSADAEELALYAMQLQGAGEPAGASGNAGSGP